MLNLPRLTKDSQDVAVGLRGHPYMSARQCLDYHARDEQVI